METFTMSRKELPRAGLIKAAVAGRITNRQAADAVQLTVRQIQRLKRRFEAGGAPALRHRSRGQPSPQRLSGKLASQIAVLMTTTYAGFNDVHLTEKLREVHGLAVCRESVRRIRLRLGRPATRPRRAPRHRRRRAREAASGALIQVDGSPFAWLEDRGPAPTQLGGMLQDLGIAYIAAHSPQAKGRIERLWATLQDRLTSELRLRRIATADAATQFLPAFIADYNRRF